MPQLQDPHSKDKSQSECSQQYRQQAHKYKMGPSPQNMRSTDLALCYSTAEFASPVWERSTHAKKLDPAVNASCRLITGCLRPTNTDSLYILAGIAPPAIRRSAASMKQRKQQEIDERIPMFNQTPVQNRLKSRKSFLKCVNPLEADTTTSEARLTMWEEINNSLPPSTTMGILVRMKDRQSGNVLMD